MPLCDRGPRPPESLASVHLVAHLLTTERLLLRDWSLEDHEAALAVFGDASVADWLTPAVTPPSDAGEMKAHRERWTSEQSKLDPPYGRWALVRREDDLVIGGM